MLKVQQRIATLTVQAPRIHIYPFSRLVNAPATKWEKLISDLEEKQRVVYLYYQPVREAIVKLTAAESIDRDGIYAEMSQRASHVVHTRTQNPIRDNQKCFECYEKIFLPQVSSFEESLLKVPQVEGTFFNGVILKGLPHMIVRDRRRRKRFVYLYPSDWKDHELDAYMELLTIIVESEFGADSADIWCMGLKSGKTIPRPRSKSRSRQACRDAAKHFKRMVDAGILSS
ncbi:hypothetical protein [Edaphobacter sp. 12200R-103]|uniref:hypothetical protein n=1 Tax=Edaphobacter sp. 12200R-103 TaxID=2703788 RepID=UPI00138D01E3|nr:hypothetical protein [Edaphobacter sp. 12200R-103]QHS53357.1 hypothetical protein GWR55_17800 [Edaphobacter sp. 12200R-103]